MYPIHYFFTTSLLHSSPPAPPLHTHSLKSLPSLRYFSSQQFQSSILYHYNPVKMTKISISLIFALGVSMAMGSPVPAVTEIRGDHKMAMGPTDIDILN